MEKSLDVDRVILREQVRQVFASYPAPALISTLLAFILVYIVHTEVPYPLVLSWATAFIVIMLLRTWIYVRYSNTDPREGNSNEWQRKFAAGAVAIAFCWAASVVLFVPYLSVANLALLNILIAGVSSGAVVSLGYVLKVARAFLIIVLAPVIVIMAMHDSALASIAVLACFFLMTLLVGAMRLNESFTNNIRIKFESERESRIKQRTDKHIQALFENSPMAIIEWNEALMITGFNAAAEDLFGYTSQELEKLNLQQLVAKERSDVLKKFSYNTLYSNTSRNLAVVLPCIDKKGNQLITEWFATVVIREETEIKFFAQILDITVKVKDDDRNKESQKHYENLLSNIPVVLYTCRPYGDFGATYISSNVEKLFGFLPSQFLEDSSFWLSNIHPEDRDRVLGDLGKLFEHGSHIHEYRFRLNDGRYIWVKDELVLGYDDKGEPKDIFGSWTNIDYEKKAQLILERFKQTLDMTLDSVFIIESDSLRCSYVNRGAIEQVGYSETELRYMRFSDLLNNIDENEFRQRMRPLVEGEAQVVSIEAECVTKDGKYSPIDMRIQYIELPNEQARFVAIVRDISDRKRVDMMKSQFISTVSHELRTPLTSIYGALSLLNDETSQSDEKLRKKMLDIAISNSQRLTMLINDIIDMDKISQGVLEVHPKVQALLPIVRRAIDENRHYALQFDVAFQLTENTSDETIVCIDESRMLQVLANLLSNAAKFSKKGDTVEISIVESDAEVKVAISDTGIGIPEEMGEKVFERFVQVDSSNTRRSGSGLGLAISRSLTEAMNGYIGYHTNSPEPGVTFYIILPRA